MKIHKHRYVKKGVFVFESALQMPEGHSERSVPQVYILYKYETAYSPSTAIGIVMCVGRSVAERSNRR